MGIKETIKAWLQPKDLSLILETDLTPKVHYQMNFPGFLDGPSEISVAVSLQNFDFHYKYVEMFRNKYAGRRLIIVDGNEINDGKIRVYVEPAVRGKESITWDELRALYPGACPYGISVPAEKGRFRIYATT